MRMYSSTCCVRRCQEPTVDSSPISCEPVCAKHMQDDLADLVTYQSTVFKRVADLQQCEAPLRLLEQRLVSDLQLLDRSFCDLRQTLDTCQAELISAVTKQHQQLVTSLKILADMNNFENELHAAKEGNDFRQVFRLNRSMEKSLKSLTLDSKLVCTDAETKEVRVVGFPDVNSRVRDLQHCIETQLATVLNVIESLDASDIEHGGPDIFETVQKVDVGGQAVRMALCSNTSGFVIDRCGGIEKAGVGSDNLELLPQPSIFVAVKSSSATRDLDEELIEWSIQLVSAKLQVSARLACSWEADQPIRDLHCDDDRQLLFIAQKHAVTITDLSGQKQAQIVVSDLPIGSQEIRVITGDADRFYVAATANDGREAIFSISKQTREVVTHFYATCIEYFTDDSFMSVQDRMLTIHQGSLAFTICTITGSLVQSESVDSPDMFGSSYSTRTANGNFTRNTFSTSTCCKMLEHRIPLLQILRLPASTRTLLLQHSANQCTLLILKNGVLVLCSMKSKR